MERTRTSISPMGLNKSTPDNAVEDGALEVCHNLRFSNGAWRNVQEFESRAKANIGQPILYKHPATDANKYIVSKQEAFDIEIVDKYAVRKVGASNLYYLDKPFSTVRLNPQGERIYSRTTGKGYSELGVVHSASTASITYLPPLQKLHNTMWLWQGTIRSGEAEDTPTETNLYLASTNVLNALIYLRQNDKLVAAYFCNDETDGELELMDINNNHIFYFTPTKDKEMVFPNWTHYYDYDEKTIYLNFNGDEIVANDAICIYDKTLNNHTIYQATYPSRMNEERFDEDGNKYIAYVYEVDCNERYGETRPLNISFDIEKIRPYNPYTTIMPLLADPKNDTRKTVQRQQTAIKEIDIVSGNELQHIAYVNGDFWLGHFGNILIVGDKEANRLLMYLYSNGKYSLYNTSDNKVSFDVSINESVASPNLTHLPLYRKFPNHSSSDGSLDGRVFSLIAEPYCKIEDKNTPFFHTTDNDGFFRGEFALFCVARAEDGSIVAKTQPRIYRTENLLDIQPHIFLFDPTVHDAEGKPTTGIDDDFTTEQYPYIYLCYDYVDIPKPIMRGDTDGNGIYKKYKSWIDNHDRYNTYVKEALESNVADKLYKLNLNIDVEGQNIYDVAIYATRLYSLYESNANGIRTNTVDLLRQPFYLMDTIVVNSDSIPPYTITSVEFENIESRPLYEPMQSVESLFASSAFEYNNALHLYNVEVNPAEIKGNQLIDGVSDISHIVIVRKYDNAEYSDIIAASSLFSNGASSLAEVQDYLITIDANITKVMFGKMEEGEFVAKASFVPKYSSSSNSSYIVNLSSPLFDTKSTGILHPIFKAPDWENEVDAKKRIAEHSGDAAKYQQVTLHNLEEEITVDIEKLQPLYVPNRIQVSATNNPTVFPYDRSYRVGSNTNEVIAINSAAIEMSDAKFGEFPLYVFTTEGIYAMQSGTESLYSAVIPIAKDVPINPNTLAVNGAVLFFTDKGLHMLSQNGVQLISAGLHEDNNRIPEWMYTCRMVHLPEYNEVLCLLMDGDETTGKAYVFSLDNNYWSERDVPQGEVLNNFEVIDMESIHNLVNEGESVVKEITLETRPIKLGANKELKRLETLVVRFEADKDEELEITIKGSIDGVEYKDLRKVSATTNTDVLIRRTPASVKYLKFVVKSSNLQSSIRLIRFDTEHYLRFVRKMR